VIRRDRFHGVPDTNNFSVKIQAGDCSNSISVLIRKNLIAQPRIEAVMLI
jgi:hypothetical protein